MMADVAYIALGSNLGNREAALSRAREAISSIRDTQLIRATAVEETEPIGPGPQGAYLNQMVSVSTTLPPRTLLSALHRIERAAGRVRASKWGPRTLDLDIVMIDGKPYCDEALTIPHPELPNREFWKRQLLELGGSVHG
ncbi:MAG TPA: 2-amino-4-hydroxy-6-hydroxymethyldihydropteridine diphosphokinase [Gemmatimonadaceae bacterium]|nr:2-amino-4-hydroxy-6-hydroxymethyldihydropteridine diphosphokinase [Gemmatimonadaceae bacterium]